MRSLPPAVVVYKAPDGTFRFPGSDDPHCRTAKNYNRLGYERIEARGWTEVRQLESRVTALQRTEMRQRVERKQQFHEEGEKIRRSDVYHGLANSFQIPILDEKGQHTGRTRSVKLSPRGRDILRAAIEHNDRKPGPKEYDTGFHVECFSQNRSNL